MIRVNLLRSTGLTTSAATMGGGGGDVSGGDQQKIAAMKLGVILLFPIGLYAYQLSNISALNSQITAITAEVAKINAKKASFGDAAPKVEKYTKQKAKIESQMSEIRKLAKNRLREVKALDSLQEITPPQVWFDSVAMANGLVKARGFSLTDEGLTSLFSKLSSSAIFSHFEPKSQAYQTTASGNRLVKFEIEFRVGRQDDE